jgi:hypothetical protein
MDYQKRTDLEGMKETFKDNNSSRSKESSKKNANHSNFKSLKSKKASNIEI